MVDKAQIARENGKKGGRPKGSGINIRDYMKEKDIKVFFEFVMANYMEDTKLTVWVGDHLMGKASQALDVTSGGKPLLISSD